MAGIWQVLCLLITTLGVSHQTSLTAGGGRQNDVSIKGMKLGGLINKLAFGDRISALKAGVAGEYATTTLKTQPPKKTTATTPVPPNDIPPDLPPGGPSEDFGDDPLCMDLMIVLDVSCSILPDEVEKARRSAIEFVEYVFNTPESDTKVGLLVYSEGTSHQFDLTGGVLTRDEIVSKLRSAELSPAGCKTHTHIALQQLREVYFTPEHGDRPNIPNVAILYTDGRTIQARYRDDTVEQAKLAKEAGIELNIVALENRKLKPDVGEYTLLPNDPGNLHLFNISEMDLTGILAQSLSQRYSENCKLKTETTINGCVDIVFAFDFSCSIEMEHRVDAINFAADIVRNSYLDSARGTAVAAFSYDDQIGNNIPFYSESDAQPFVEDLIKIDRNGFGCRTKTYDAFITANDLFTNSDRNDTAFGDVLILFGDGMTAPLHRRKATIEQAQALKDKGVTIIWIAYPNNKGKSGMELEIKATASDLDFGPGVYDTEEQDKELILSDLILFFNTRFPCQVQR